MGADGEDLGILRHWREMAKDGQKWGGWWQRRGVELDPRLRFLWNRCHPAGRSGAAPPRNSRSRTCRGGSRNSSPFQESLELRRPGNPGSGRKQQLVVSHALLCAGSGGPKRLQGCGNYSRRAGAGAGAGLGCPHPFPRFLLKEGQVQTRAGQALKREAL